MTRHPTSPSDPPPFDPPPTDPPPAEGSSDAALREFIDGLALDRIHRPAIITFLSGLPRRATEQLAVETTDTEQTATPPVSPSSTGELEPESVLDDRRVDAIRQSLAAMADRLDVLIERLQAAGYPLNPAVSDVELAEKPSGLPPELHSSWKRFETAVAESIRWAKGVPADVWADDLVEHARAAVGELSWQLRRLNDESVEADH